MISCSAGDGVVWDNQLLWGDSLVWEDVIGVRTDQGLLFGSSIDWGSVSPGQVIWFPPDAGAAGGESVVDLSVNEP